MIHAKCGYARGTPYGGLAGLEMAGREVWSHTLTAAGVTPASKVTPGDSGSDLCIITVTAMVDAWVAIGTAPDATQDPRDLVPARTTLAKLAPASARVAWTPAS